MLHHIAIEEAVEAVLRTQCPEGVDYDDFCIAAVTVSTRDAARKAAVAAIEAYRATVNA